MTSLTPRLPKLTTVTLVLLLFPANFYAASLLLTPSRVLLVLVTPWALWKLLSGQVGRLTLTDAAMIAFVTWRCIALYVTCPDRALQYSGSNTVIILGAYLVGRVTIRTADQMEALARWLVTIVVLMLPFAVYEAKTGSFVLPRLIDALPGVTSIVDVNYPRRLGLDRAQVLFDHPILFGLVCTLAVGFALLGYRDSHSLVRRGAVGALVLAAVFFSVSSGAFLAAMFQVALILYAVTFRVRHRWAVLIGLLVIAYAFIEAASDRPGIFAVVERLSFDSYTAWLRRMIFEYGTAQVAETPWFGVGLNPWAHPAYMKDSIDNYWLGMAILFGIPALVCVATAFVAALVQIGLADFSGTPRLQRLRLAWVITFVSVSLTLATVFIWSDASSIIYLVFGSGMWMTSQRRETARVVPPLRFSRFDNAQALPFART